jgi:hypothetical protein
MQEMWLFYKDAGPYGQPFVFTLTFTVASVFADVQGNPPATFCK